MELAKRLNFCLAWKKVKEDLRDICFVNHPIEVDLIDSDLIYWFDSLREKFSTGEYNPSRCAIIDVPKPDWHLRPAGILTIEDHLIYSALLLDSIEEIKQGISWSSMSIRYSSILKENQNGSEWFEFPMNGWTKFREDSLSYIKNHFEWVVFSDISAFFENIDINRLYSNLENLNILKDNLEMLTKCLRRWCEPRGRGIPQGFSPSNILAEIYLDNIDRRLNNQGVNHLRYVDDIRIFCRTEKEAITNLHLLTILLRERGLNLQTAKSFIFSKNDALAEISGVSKIISDLNKKISNEMQNIPESEYFSGMPFEIKYLVEEKEISIDLQTLIQAFEEYFLSQNAIKFDRSLFHFIVNRFSAEKNPKALHYCLDLIALRPEETKFILQYFTNLPEHYEMIIKNLTNLIQDEKIIYEYQIFLFIRWLWNIKYTSDSTISLARKLILKTNLLQFIREYCITYLGEFGDSSDLEQIESLYMPNINPILKATIIYSLKNLSKSRRNSIYGKAKGDHYLVDLAIKRACSEH